MYVCVTFIKYLLQSLKTRYFTGGTIRLHKSQRSNVNTSDYSFAKYASTYFNSNANGWYSTQPLKKPLLEHDSPTEDFASQAIWITILRFMGDMAEMHIESNGNKFVGSYRKPNVMIQLNRTLSNSASTCWKDDEVLGSPLVETQHQRLIRRTLKRKSKLPEEMRRNDGLELEYYQHVLNTYSDNLNKLHFIIGHGILRQTLRDEILAQVCKQLTQNPNRISYTKGWILLALCISCFPPSQRFEPYFRHFLQTAPDLMKDYCENLLERIIQNGARSQPPSWVELQAIRTLSPITIDIFLMNNDSKKLQIDSSSTAQEAVEQLSENLGLKDKFGFTVVIGLFDNIMSLGNGQQHILDAISSCEQYAKEQGQNDRVPPWKLYFRKEMFTSWYNPAEDRLATQLIYKQIMRGLNYGEYRCRTEQDIAMLAALSYYAEYGAAMNLNVLRRQLPNLIPKDLIIAEKRAFNTWEARIQSAFSNHEYVHRYAPQRHAMEDICLFAKMSWPMSFSRFFEAIRIEGPRLVSNNLTIAINSIGVYFLDETEQILAEMSYIEIVSVYVESCEWKHIDELHIETVQNENFSFNCKEAHDVFELIQYMLDNLKLHSKYAVAMQNYNPIKEKQTVQLSLQCGDLILFDTNPNEVLAFKHNTNSWIQGVCNGKRGEFSTAIVNVLPTIEKPSAKIEQTYKEFAKLYTKKSMPKYNTIQRQRMHTLEKFAVKYFRSSFKSASKTDNNKLWQHSRHILEAPLLQSLQESEDVFFAALQMYFNILMYMGDIPANQNLESCVDSIFKPALECGKLRDELYCQLMKQLTNNRVHDSEEAGWDLMYLACGITYPDSFVMRELEIFLRTRPHNLVNQCLLRIKRTMTNGSRRYSPHIIEVKAIQQRCLHIYHKIYFPDNTMETFEIAASTRGIDLQTTILDHLGIKYRNGYNLFIQIGDKVFSIPEKQVIFDVISEALIWIQQIMASYGTNADFDGEYALYFMKKLWLGTIQPGYDVNADLVFHYPQEETKYLKSYYKLNKVLTIELAALCYLANFGYSLSSLQIINIYETLQRVLPENLLPLVNAYNWKTHIIKQLKVLEEQEVTDTMAKVKFLMLLAQQQMFGSTFFMVDQETDFDLPKKILLAINRLGFHIINPENKDLLRSYQYNELSHRTVGKTFFHIRFGNMIGASKLHCNTYDGYKIDDLISSYMKY